MLLSEKIQLIIDKRRGQGDYVGKGHLDIVKEKQKFFSSLIVLLEEFQSFRETVLSQIENKEGEYYKMSVEDADFEQNILDASPGNTIELAKEALKECDNLYKRFCRDSINISVIGRARQGKSRLLRTISGVSNEIIPTDNGGDCTGTKSIIYNSDIDGVKATIHFFTEKELIEHVQKYLDALGSGVNLGNVSQIPQIPLKEIEERGLVNTNKKESQYEHLKKYVEHFDEYINYLGQDIPEDEETRIRRYVAQYLSDGTRTYAYLGVKEAEIFNRFSYSDAGKIVLVDTIGLGDTSLGLRDKMIDTLINDSDVAVLIRRPDSKGDSIKEEDNDLYDLINARMVERDIEKWLFYALNIYDDNLKSGEILYEQLNKKMGKTLKAAFITKVDCASQKEVEEKLLIPMLESLSSNLMDVDNNLMFRANELFANVHTKYFELFTNIGRILSGGIKESLSGGGLFDDLYEGLGLSMELKSKMKKYSDMNHVSEEILDAVKSVVKGIAKKCPSREDIIHRLNMGGQEGLPWEVYHYYAGNLRAQVREELEKVNNDAIEAIQEAAKIDIIAALKDECGGRLGLIPLLKDTEDNSIEWLNVFVEEKLGAFPLIANAFSELYNRRLQIADILEDKAEESLMVLDPDHRNDKFEQPDFKGMTDEEVVTTIDQGLKTSIPVVAKSMVEGVSKELTIPYRRFYTWIRTLNDKIIIKKEGRRELKNFYREIAPVIWKKDFRDNKNKNLARGKWNEYYDCFAKNVSKNLFVIKIV